MTRRTKSFVLGSLTVATVATFLTACAGNDDSTPPTPTTTTVAVSVHPCDVFDGAMTAAGYTLYGRNDRTSPYQELVCDWTSNNPLYSPAIAVVGKPYDVVVGDQRLVERESLSVAGREASVGDASSVTDMCMVSIDVPPGTLQISVPYVPPELGPLPTQLTTMDQACTEAKKVLDIITPVLPDHT